MKIRSLLILIACPCLMAQQPPTAQEHDVKKSNIAGLVLNAQAGDGIPNATVSLLCEIAADPQAPCSQTSARTDNQGRFAFQNVAAGRYMLMASCPKFTSNGPPLEVTVPSDDLATDIRLNLAPAGIISGTVVDSAGDAQPQLQVTLFLDTRSKGVRSLLEVNTATTEAKGQSEFSGLPPGKYLLVAGKINLLVQDPSNTSPSAAAFEHSGQVPGQKMGLRTFYPGVISPDDASLLHCEEGCEYSAIKLKLQSGAPVRISGRATGFDPSRFPGGVYVSLTPFGLAESSLSLRVRPDQDGRFQFSAVPPGHYIGRLVGRQAIPHAPNATVLYQPGDRRLLASEQEIFVGRSDLQMEFLVPPSIELAGQIGFPDGGNPKDWPALNIKLVTIGGDPKLGAELSAQTQKDGSFSFSDCPPTKVALRVEMPPGIFMESVKFNERDALNNAIDLRDVSHGSALLTLKKGVSRISGSIDKPSDGSVVTSSTAVRLIPANYSPEGSGQIYRGVVKDNAFSFDNVPPGTYYAIALANPRDDLWEFPEFLREILSSAAVVEVKENSSQTVQLQLVSESDIQRIIGRLGI